MSGQFGGFSEDEINKINSRRSSRNVKPAILHGPGIRRVPDKKTRSLSERAVTEIEKTKSEDNSLDILDSSLEISGIKIEEKKKNSKEDKIQFGQLDNLKAKQNDDNSDESILQLEEKPEKNENQKSKPSPFRGISLRDFENQRKLIEEQNAEKKNLLYKAIELHSQKTAAESKKIQEIKSELDKLDSELAVDVAILRKQIEAACIHYSNIQKEYNRIESQFLKAKIDLHNASERKELLTEHLCTVIAHNEQRKSEKLSKLMEKAGISCNGNINMLQNQTDAN